MNDYTESVHPWGSTSGERTTTDYALGGKNEFGQRVPPKPVFNLHGVHVPNRPPVDPREVALLALEFHRHAGRWPTELHIAGPKQSTTARSFSVPGFGPLLLSIAYEAKETHVA